MVAHYQSQVLAATLIVIALEKHKIKRVDRLCSNTKLHRDIKLIYTRMAYLLVSNIPQPIIHIDWSDLDDRKESFLIRASLAAQGRSLTLYEGQRGRNELGASE